MWQTNMFKHKLKALLERGEKKPPEWLRAFVAGSQLRPQWSSKSEEAKRAAEWVHSQDDAQVLYALMKHTGGRFFQEFACGHVNAVVLEELYPITTEDTDLNTGAIYQGFARNPELAYAPRAWAGITCMQLPSLSMKVLRWATKEDMVDHSARVLIEKWPEALADLIDERPELLTCMSGPVLRECLTSGEPRLRRSTILALGDKGAASLGKDPTQSSLKNEGATQ